jgi:hypothetical protein
MTRATRFAAYLAPLVIYYLLALLGIVNIPFMSQESSDALVPVVSLFSPPRTVIRVQLKTADLETSSRSGYWSLSERIR